MQIKILIPVIAAMLIAICSLPNHYIANADTFPSSSQVQPDSKQDAMNTTITAGLQLANQSSQLWQEKLYRNQSDDQQEQSLAANRLNSRNDKVDNHSPSVLSQLPF
jgi:hypothetical protein